MKQLQRRSINSPKPLGAYSQAMQVTAGTLVFVAGQVAIDASDNLLGKDDVMAQTRQVFENIGQVLANAGACFTKVAKFTTYLVGRTSIQPFLNARAALYPVLFPNGDYPPNTLLIIDGLVRDEFMVEIKTIAALP